MQLSYNNDFPARRYASETVFYFYICNPQGDVTYASPSQRSILGYTDKAFLGVFGRHLSDNPLNKAGIERHNLAAAGSAQPAFDLEMRDAAGALRQLRIREYPYGKKGAEVTAVYGIAEDITSQKEREATLGRDQLCYQRAEKMAKIGSWSLDIQNNRLQWSDEIYRIFEIDPACFEASYEAFLSLVHPDDLEAVNQAYLQSIEEQTPYNIEHRLLLPDGRVKYVHEECETFFDDQGEPLSSFGTIQDISAMKALQFEHEAQQELMFHQSKMAQMGEMINSIAHQWKQPLHQINSVLPTIEEDFERGALTKEALAAKLDEIEMLTAHMSQTVESFQNFFHPNKKETVFSVADAVAKVSTLFQSEFERSGIAYELTTRRDFFVRGSEKDFVQAILSILHNSKECFIHRGISRPKIMIRIEGGEKRGFVTLTDNAGGIPDEYADKIFDPYFTTKRKGHGTGLGLYISKMLIETAMEGTLVAENGEEGAMFIIDLPLAG